MKLEPKRPPGRPNRKALAFEAEIARLRSEGYPCEAIWEALLDAGLALSLSAVKREVARLGKTARGDHRAAKVRQRRRFPTAPMTPPMPQHVAYAQGETVGETVSPIEWRQHTDSAPVRVGYRARPNSFSSAYRTSASHLLGLKDTSLRENLLGRARVSAPRRTGADGSNRSLPLPTIPPCPALQCP